MGQDDAVWADFGHGMPGAITWCDPNYSCTTLLRADANVDGPNHPNECSAADKASCLTNFYGVVPCAPGVYGPCFGSYLGHYRLMAFVGCQTGASATSGSNLVDEAVDTMGVGSAIGFKQEITYGVSFGPVQYYPMETWSSGFFGSLADGDTISEAQETALSDVEGMLPFGWMGPQGFDSDYVRNGSTTITPAGYDSAAVPSPAETASVTPQPGSVSLAGAVTAAQAVVPGGSAQVTYVAPVGTTPGFYTVKTSSGVANVDATTGQVRTFVVTALVPSSDAVKVSTDHALSIAQVYLVSHGIGSAGLTPSVSLMDHGSYADYVVRWEGRIGGARVPGMREVRINAATGAVFAVSNLSTPYATPPNPKLTSDQAAAIALNAMSGPAKTIKGSDLVVTFDAGGRQQLAWQVEVESDGPI